MASSAAAEHPAMSLNELLAGCDLEPVAEDVAISQIAYHSAQAKPGSLFCCLPGERHDGHSFASQAVASGSVAVLCERPLGLNVPEIQVASARAAMAQLASTFHGNPSKDIPVVAVTGTNGKTSVVKMLASIYRAAGRKVATLGTLSGPLTTPEAPELQQKLAQFRCSEDAVVMEVSSHAIAQHRIDGISFELCGFTNLSPEHLDYHSTMDRYFEAKKALFAEQFTHKAVICTDGHYGKKLYDSLPLGIRAAKCMLSDVRILAETLEGSTVEIAGLPIRLSIPGWFTIANANMAFAMAAELGFSSASIKAGLEQLSPIPGRFEVVWNEPVTVVVDYAHTSHALEKALLSCRQLTPAGKCHVVFGCGGERDASKRSAMGEAASRLADFIYLTNDNPRGEDPEKIISDILAGIERSQMDGGVAASSGSAPQDSAPLGSEPQISTPPNSDPPYLVELDRRSAIKKALEATNFGDIVLIAGKGHEDTQQIGETQMPFDDREVARELAEAIFSQPLSSQQERRGAKQT